MYTHQAHGLNEVEAGDLRLGQMLLTLAASISILTELRL